MVEYKYVEKQSQFDKYAEAYEEAKAQYKNGELKKCQVIRKACKLFKGKKRKQWLADERVNLGKSQAYEFIKIAEACERIPALKKCLKRNSLKTIYRVVSIKDKDIQSKLIELMLQLTLTERDVIRILKNIECYELLVSELNIKNVNQLGLNIDGIDLIRLEFEKKGKEVERLREALEEMTVQYQDQLAKNSKLREQLKEVQYTSQVRNRLKQGVRRSFPSW